MNRQTVIVVITPTLQTIECWGNLKKACIAHGWAYNTLSKRKLPIGYEGKQGSYKDLTFDFCEECGNVTNVDLS